MYVSSPAPSASSTAASAAVTTSPPRPVATRSPAAGAPAVPPAGAPGAATPSSVTVPSTVATPPSGWPLPATDWVASTPAWPAPAAPPPLPLAATSRRGTGSLLAAAAAGATVLSVGIPVTALISSLLVSSVLAGRADDLGRGIGSALGESMLEQTGTVLCAGGLLGGYGTGPVDQTDPVPPGIRGTDPALDGYAQGCFAGALEVCDRLYDESAPFSEYERYASTCGGRVKPLAVAL